LLWVEGIVFHLMTRCVKKQLIIDAVPHRKQGYIEEVERRKLPGNDPDTYCFKEEDFSFLRHNYSSTQMPSMIQMAKNAASAIGNEVKHIASGNQHITDADVANRKSICNGCEFYTPNIPELPKSEKDKERCVKCGCFMAYKQRLTSATCPVGKW